jgi:hypothetical protein
VDRLPLFQQVLMSFFQEAAPAVGPALDFLTAAQSQDLVGKTSLTVRLAADFLAAAQSQNLVGKAVDSHRILENLLAIQLETLETQKESLRTQRRSLDVQIRTTRKLSESLGIQRNTLDHVRSIDRKTGGEFPPP